MSVLKTFISVLKPLHSTLSLKKPQNIPIIEKSTVQKCIILIPPTDLNNVDIFPHLLQIFFNHVKHYNSIEAIHPLLTTPLPPTLELTMAMKHRLQ